MTPQPVIIKFDATCRPMVAAGESVRQGQKLCEESGEQTTPVSGTIKEVRFDPEAHEFVVVVAPTANP